MLEQYTVAAEERRTQGLPPLPLTAEQVREITALLPAEDQDQARLLELLRDRVEPGVSKAAQVKAAWLEQVALGECRIALLSREAAVELLATMEGGYNVSALIRLLQVEEVAAAAAEALKGLIKVYDAFQEVVSLGQHNSHARGVLESWARAEWFTSRPPLPAELRLRAYLVRGEINTDDFSPGNQAQSRADIPLHATFFGHSRFPEGIAAISRYRAQGERVAFGGDVVGTGSSRKSAINSMAWHIGEEVPFIPNKKRGGVILGSTIAPIFYATARDAGMLPVECDLGGLESGEELILDPHGWTLTRLDGSTISLQPPPATLLDEYRAGGRLNLIIGRNLSRWAAEALELPAPAVFAEVSNPEPPADQPYTLAQKMIGRACGVAGVVPGTVCEPAMTTVGSQDTTGPMTMQEIAELACLRFKAELVMQSFCHTAAYPKASDPGRWQTMTETTVECGGVALKPGDGVIHSWLNKMLVPDTVGTGGDSHTRFPLGISFPAGSGLVAFAAALGFMPLEMPESVLVRFRGRRRPGITVRDMVNAIPYQAIQEGLLSVEKKNKKNVFAGTILEIEGIDDLGVEEAFELADASAERSAAACTLALPLEAVVAQVEKNVALLRELIAEGYQAREALARRVEALEAWLAAPHLLRADEGASYKAVVEIDLDRLSQPILACPNDPDDVRLLEEVAGTPVDEAFIGSCMTHLGHHRQAVRLFRNEPYAAARVWVAPATRMERDRLREEGGLSVYAQVGGRVEIPGCSLCMGNQARVRPGSTVISTSTRNFDNRLGDGARVFLGSAELTAISGLAGKLPTVEEYFRFLEQKGVTTV
ncbi:bifunctional aconitate hydratase 2/2-methylisocitrate dehydratase [Desulfogranum mediterraneum]|uniref:bifunctional aconitate hydratase 2/2-methylisocitrate dehydratase n=1 Tax=Desulfogranum mediterraneum TaxID=160661 RepID=UPI00040A22B0|nr:bifunctional aconitate hydratase 2/2-methylisocitrate dehydratase [Desulfogranum mediterraneum]